MKNPFSRFFRARDKPGATDSVSAAPTFYFGSSAAGKSVTASTAIQMSTVYACVRVIAETIARVIRNASRFLTGEAREGAIVQSSSDNRRTYNSSVSSTIQVQQMVVRDEQDIRSLAVEIATLTRRQQRGKGLRLL